jgi:SNF2 family DNA or RNA helicase
LKLIETTCQKEGEWSAWVKVGDTVWYLLTVDWDDSQKAKEVAKSANFNFSGMKDPVTGVWKGRKLWYTNDFDKAAKLSDYAIGDCRKKLTERQVMLTSSLADSKKADTDEDFPRPEGLNYYPFQKAGISYMLKRPEEIKGILLADDMGLGKTIQGIGVYNSVPEIKTCLVICPATLKLNWQREFQTWLTKKSKVAIATPKTVPLPEHGYDIIITNYETMAKINKKIAHIVWDLVIIDEAHYLKDTKTLRYQSIFPTDIDKFKDRAFQKLQYKKIILATGTPIVNKMKEMWPLITICDPVKWNQKTWYYYNKRYCYDDSPAKLQELQQNWRQRFMIRRLKVDVLKELPPKIRQVVELEWREDDNDVICAMSLENAYLKAKAGSDDAIELAVRAELAKASDSDDEYKAAIEAIGERVKIAFEDMAKVRHDTAVAKIPYCVDYIENLLDNGQKIIIMAHHHDVVHAFAKKWPLESITISGETKMDDRQKNVDRFQTDNNCRLAICSIKAAGVGITLTAASTVVFVELDWVPGNITQAEDRAHRIGQTDTVNVYHLVLKESIDVNMAQTLISKQKVIEAALDKTMELEPVILTRDNAATKNTSRAKIAEQAKDITQWQILYVHQALKFLANDDGDYARGLNGIGYNKIDTAIGHSLADIPQLSPKQAVLGMKICKKYKGQLPSEIYNKIYKSEEVERETW